MDTLRITQKDNHELQRNFFASLEIPNLGRSVIINKITKGNKTHTMKKYILLFSALLITSCEDKAVSKNTDNSTSTNVEQVQKEVDLCTATPEERKEFLDGQYDLAIVKKMLATNSTLVHLKINNKNNERALHWAALNGNVEIIKEMIDHGADIDAKDQGQMTPLHWAAWQGKLDAVKFLIEKGATLNAVSKYKQTPLDRAINDKHDDVVKYLESLGGLIAKDIKQ